MQRANTTGVDSIQGHRSDAAFTVDAGLLFQLGEELVNRRSVALAELIKNAYDADATRVVVRLTNVSTPGGTIEVIDNGAGLSFRTFVESWLRIATRAKVDEPTSPVLARARAGAKGVGRFAARRLAGGLVVDSIARVQEAKRSGYEHVHAVLDWSRFQPGLRLEDVSVPISRRDLPSSPAPETGVTLTLTGVKDAWAVEDVKELQSDLLRLVGPASAPEDDFQVILEAPEFPSFTGDIADRFLDYGLARLWGRLAPNGTPTYELQFRGEKTMRFTPAAERYPEVGLASFDITLFVYKSTFFEGLPIKTRDAQQRGRDHGGVHIYVDRFRVPPYGDTGDDWLRLDEDRGGRLDATPEALSAESKDGPRRPMLLLPGNNQLFGSVHLSRASNPRLQQTVNRERFIENDAFGDLQSFVRLGINWMTLQYARRLAAERAAAPQPDPESLIEKARDKFVSTIEASGLGDEERTEVVQSFDLAMHAVRARQDELISELSMLRVLASTGTMIAVFEHQLMASLSGLRELAARVRRLVKNVPAKSKKPLEDEAASLHGWVEDLQHQADLLGLLFAKESRTRRRKVIIRAATQAVAESFSGFMRDNAIEFQNEIPATLKTPALYPAELTAVILNLFTNALKAVRHVPARKIRASGQRTEGHVILRIDDTGVGADPSAWEDYFLPFQTTSTPDPLLGHGTGLGLKIVRDIAAVYGGTARFIEPAKGWKTTLEIDLPES